MELKEKKQRVLELKDGMAEIKDSIDKIDKEIELFSATVFIINQTNHKKKNMNK